MRVEGEVGVAGDGEVVNGERVERLGRLELTRDSLRCADLGEAVGDEEDEDDEEAIGGPFNLEVAEEGVGTEAVKSLDGALCVAGNGYLKAGRKSSMPAYRLLQGLRRARREGES